MRVIFMGTPVFAVPALAALCAAGHEIVAVYTQPPRPAGRGQKETPSPVHAYAAAHGLSVRTPVSLKQETVPEADVAVVAAYGLLLPAQVLAAPRHGCINIHPSLLPRWRGAAPIARTLMAGDTHTGVCIMQMDAGLDTGDVLKVEQFAIPPGMDAGALHDALAEIGARMVVEVLPQLDALPRMPQSAEGVTYAAKLTKEEARIDWQRTASALCHHVRGLSPAPGAWCDYQGERLKVFAAQPVPCAAAAPPGTVLDDQLTVACGEGTALQLLEIQRPGKTRMRVEDALKGWAVPQGAVFEPYHPMIL